jgi:hypothetical protein
MVSYGDAIRVFGQDRYVENMYDVWSEWASMSPSLGPGLDLKVESGDFGVSYNLCFDDNSQMCTMQRNTPTESGCDAGRVADYFDSDANLFRDDVGKIVYGIDPVGKVVVAQATAFDSFFGGGGFQSFGADLSDCRTIDYEEAMALKEEDPIQFARVYRHLLFDGSTSDEDNLIQPVKYDLWECSSSDCKGEPTKHTVYLYGTGSGLVMRGAATGGDTVIFTNASTVLPEQQEQRNSQTYTTIEDLFSSAVPAEQSMGGLAKFTCDNSTPNPYDSTFKFMGLEILKPSVLIVLVLLSTFFGIVVKYIMRP